MLARTVQGLLLLGTRMFQQSNRNLLGLVMVWMAKDLGFGVGERGTLLSAIAAGYFFTQIPGGALADKLGAKLVMCAPPPPPASPPRALLIALPDACRSGTTSAPLIQLRSPNP